MIDIQISISERSSGLATNKVDIEFTYLYINSILLYQGIPPNIFHIFRMCMRYGWMGSGTILKTERYRIHTIYKKAKASLYLAYVCDGWLVGWVVVQY